MTLTSKAFRDGEVIPKQHTADGADLSPPLAWTGIPEGAKSLALICDDPDAPTGTWVHWVLWNLPPETRELPQGVPAKETLPSGAKQGKNDFRKVGYNGPAPPPGSAHRYYFKLYALDATLDLAPGATKKQLLDAMGSRVLAQGQLMGKYQR
jgi:Raf kinase inhibitor-like YbhB/YbcL family protein